MSTLLDRTVSKQVLLASNTVLALTVLLQTKLGQRLWQRLTTSLSWLTSQRVAEPDSPSAEFRSLLGKDYVPPLPKPIADALERSCLCFLATAGSEHTPHLSLMRFTYTKEFEENSEVMIISTRRNTKKFQLITCNTNVALLVHQFDTETEKDGNNYDTLGSGRTRCSITLNGRVRVQEGEMAEHYRRIHLAANREYSQFIVGDDIAIVTVHLDTARVCDINDRVAHFTRHECSWKDVTKEAGAHEY
uniref:Pyridoxamine 5'-phosphate oxidase N-terminal domain-containing protein n=1 Tax=Haptolina brevifila TaxID=156173 RepID=A0A7S2IJN9_9EUKA|mmetsp:Transcript_66995/g.132786  ORF Transcript_66995/g.132786 Transcript_66995/m.132786 type:complete len:247 (+) Transcript_66995:63-803(+)